MSDPFAGLPRNHFGAFARLNFQIDDGRDGTPVHTAFQLSNDLMRQFSNAGGVSLFFHSREVTEQ